MAALALVSDPADREVIEFDHGVRAYEPTAAGGYWRLRWEEAGRRRETTARDRATIIAKAEETVERLVLGTDTALARSKGADLIAHYLDPQRRTPRGRPWSLRHREEQESYCRRFVTPALAAVECRRMTRRDFQRALDGARTRSTADHLRRCITALVRAGIEDGYLLARQDVLRAVHWRDDPQTTEPSAVLGLVDADEWAVAVTDDEIPDHEAVQALARAAAEHTGVWWRELELLLVAYSGLRWGEHAALVARRVDCERRRVDVARQVVESRSGLSLALPKGRKRRTTIFPDVTPTGADLVAMIERRLAEVGDNGLLFPAPRGQMARRSNYRRNVWVRAAHAADWPRGDDGRAAWTFHSLRHVFATWLLARPGVTIEDVSRVMGHSSTRITQEIYVHFLTGRLDALFAATSESQAATSAC